VVGAPPGAGEAPLGEVLALWDAVQESSRRAAGVEEVARALRSSRRGFLVAEHPSEGSALGVAEGGAEALAARVASLRAALPHLAAACERHAGERADVLACARELLGPVSLPGLALLSPAGASLAAFSRALVTVEEAAGALARALVVHAARVLRVALPAGFSAGAAPASPPAPSPAPSPEAAAAPPPRRAPPRDMAWPKPPPARPYTALRALRKLWGRFKNGHFLPQALHEHGPGAIALREDMVDGLHDLRVGVSIVPMGAASPPEGGVRALAQLQFDLKARLNPGAVKFLLAMERGAPPRARGEGSPDF